LVRAGYAWRKHDLLLIKVIEEDPVGRYLLGFIVVKGYQYSGTE